jgi:hypothetical protein
MGRELVRQTAILPGGQQVSHDQARQLESLPKEAL